MGGSTRWLSRLHHRRSTIVGRREVIRPKSNLEKCMERAQLKDTYRKYLACLNQRDWGSLGRYVHDDVVHNDRQVGLTGYREMLERDVRDIPDLRFDVDVVASDPPFIASRIAFDCTPAGMFLGLPVHGRRILFAENVFYRFREGRIARVWSVIDKPAIEAQLRELR